MTRLDYTFDRQIMLEREDSRMEGLAEGHAEGLAEGRAEGHEKGLTEGRKQGLAEGVAKERILLISKKMKKNKSLNQIAEELEDTVENVEPVYNAISKMPVDFDVDDIYRRIYSRDCAQGI